MINMSAGVTSANYIYRQVVTIPQADVQIMDSAQQPYTILQTNNSFYAIPIACYVYCINQTVGYTGFTHLHLTNSAQYGIGGIIGSYAQNATTSNEINSIGGDLYSLLINFQQSPARYGSRQSFKQIDIFWDTPVTAGDGDMVVTLLYTINDLF
jgi:hypothetical protein